MPLKAYVHLDYGRSPETWTKEYEKGMVFEKQPYGYHWAKPWINLEYSKDFKESRIEKFFRRGLKTLLGFDLIHAYKNRHCASMVNVIWTHTEAEYLADAMLMKFGLMKRRPLIGQSIWLWDNWKKLTWIKKIFYKWLLEEVAISTTHSSINAKIATTVLGRKVLQVPFGVEPTFKLEITKNRGDNKIRIVAPGNDRHRDWKTLREVAKNNQDMEIIVLSKRWRARRLVSSKIPNFTVRQATGIKELIYEYSKADIVAIPLLPNFHVSGITVAMESITAGRPVVMTRTGGVEDYFGTSVNYSEPLSPKSMAMTFRIALKIAKNASVLAQRRTHITQSGLLIKDFGLRHVLLSNLAMGLSTTDQDLKISQFSPVVL